MSSNYLPSWNADIKDLYQFSKIKLIISDIDGTLLSYGSKVEHDKFIRLVKNLRNKGVHLTFATGRAYSGISDLAEEIPISSAYPMILYNGSTAVYPITKKVLFYNKFDTSTLKQLTSIIDRVGGSILLYCINEAAMSNELQNYTEHIFAIGNPSEDIIDPNGQNIRWNIPIPKNIFCIAAMIDLFINQSLINTLKTAIVEIPTISITQSTNHFLEIRPQHSNKGTAIQEVCRQLNIDVNKVMTIGDNDNDIEMFKCTNMSIAVNNSSQHAEQAAKYVSQYNSLSGVIEALELVRQSKRYESIMQGGIFDV
jgi:Cof subfamily protein (haloacid dehalogenase superfamily)